MPICLRKSLWLATAALVSGGVLLFGPQPAIAAPVGIAAEMLQQLKPQKLAKVKKIKNDKLGKAKISKNKKTQLTVARVDKLSDKEAKKRSRLLKKASKNGPTAPAIVTTLANPAIATLTGDSVVITESSLLANNGGVGPFSYSGIVGAGNDTDSPFPYTYDLNFGVDGNQFQLVSLGAFCAFITKACTASPFSISFSDLNFSNGAELVDIAGLFSVFPDTTFFVTANSVTFLMTDAAHLAGVLLSGTFVTREITAVPVPLAAPLLATGIGGLGLLAWRRGRKQRRVKEATDFEEAIR